MRYAILRASLSSALLFSPTAVTAGAPRLNIWAVILAQASDPQPPPKVPPKKDGPKPGGSGDPIPWGRTTGAANSDHEWREYERLDKALSDDRIEGREVEVTDGPPPK